MVVDVAGGWVEELAYGSEENLEKASERWVAVWQHQEDHAERDAC